LGIGSTAKEPLLRERLRLAAEKARRTLTDHAEATMEVLWQDRLWSLEITSAEFEAKAAALLAKLREPVLRALRDGEVRADDLKEIVMVGGATRMPVVRRAVTKMFGRFPATSVHPDEAVVIGAAIQAGLKARDAALREVVLTDVCPYSLGVDVSETGPGGTMRHGIFSPIIERNTVVPASRSKIFSPAQTGQKVVVFGIYQGEARLVAENIKLGQVEVPVPPRRAGEITLECRFTYDVNGLIEVDVHVPETDERRQLVIVDEEDRGGDDLEKRRAALAALKVHPRDLDANRAALARASRCYETFLGERRSHVGELITRFETALDGQDPRLAELARKDLTQALDALEGETWL